MTGDLTVAELVAREGIEWPAADPDRGPRHALAGLPTPVTLLLLCAVGAVTYLALMALLARDTMNRLIGVLRSARSMRPA